MLVACLAAAWWLVPAQVTASQKDDGLELVRAYRQAHEGEILGTFLELLSIPNVASDGEGIRRNAEFLRKELLDRGFRSEIWRLPEAPEAPPIVYGALDVPGASRTLGIYLHYDGQPVVPEEWSTPGPWRPTIYDGPVETGGQPVALPFLDSMDPDWRVYGRSASDDKAPFAALTSALDALSANRRAPTSNLRLVFEGEEEVGSPHLGRYLSHYRAELADVDAWIILDGPVHQSGVPQLVFGVRGYAELEITVYGPNRALHSGHYGNWAPNPIDSLTRLVASMKGPGGEVVIPGFYSSTVVPEESDREAIRGLPTIDDDLRRELGLASTEGGGAPLAERVLVPALNVRGFHSGSVGEQARNVIPPMATASFDLRLAKGNDPVEMIDLVETHVRDQGFHVVRTEPTSQERLTYPKIARLSAEARYPAVRTSMDEEIVRTIIDATERVAGGPVILLPTLGGSLPLHHFTTASKAPIVIAPIANHDNNQHAPNENLRIGNLWYGVDLLASLLTMPMPDTRSPLRVDDPGQERTSAPAQ